MPLTRLAAATIVLAALACREPTNAVLEPSAESVLGIQGGEPTGDAYGNVGALLFDYDRNGRIDVDDTWCTGSLVAPDAFLTAAHCVVGRDTPAGTQFHVSFAPDLNARGVRFIAATGYVWHPGYSWDSANADDIALVFLPPRSTRGVTPMRLPRQGALDALAANGALGRALFVNVGYGVAANRRGIPRFTFDGLRRMSLSEFMGLQPTWLGLLMNSSATGEGGDCYGDSGGPKLLQGDATTIYATVVTGDLNCRATSWSWRVDTPSSRRFLGQYLALP